LVASSGAGVLIVEHKTDLLDRVCSQVALLRDGGLARVGAAAEILADPELQASGVEPPARVRLNRAAAAAGLSLPAEALAG
ncbi:MAG: hypothetical protein ACRDGL_03650, partial [Candidatus Limnocylindrales bacterium]